MFSVIERLYKSFPVINSSVQIFLKLSEKFLEIHFQKQPPEVFHEKTVLKSFAIFAGKHLC